jgi:hypothetical protein
MSLMDAVLADEAEVADLPAIGIGKFINPSDVKSTPLNDNRQFFCLGTVE